MLLKSRCLTTQFREEEGRKKAITLKVQTMIRVTEAIELQYLSTILTRGKKGEQKSAHNKQGPLQDLPAGRGN